MPDLIDRQNLIESFTGPGGWTVYGKYVPAIVSRINVQPAVKVTGNKFDTPMPPFDEDDPDVLYCQRCGSGEYLENEDGNRNNYCGQCGQRIDWDAWDRLEKGGA